LERMSDGAFGAASRHKKSMGRVYQIVKRCEEAVVGILMDV